MQRDDSLIVGISGSVLPLFILIGFVYGLFTSQIVAGLIIGIVTGLILASILFISFTLLEDAFVPKA